MEYQEDLQLVFTGSPVDAYFIKSLLEEKGIECTINDLLQESAGAGWGGGSPENSCEVYVLEENLQAAEDIIALSGKGG